MFDKSAEHFSSTCQTWLWYVKKQQWHNVEIQHQNTRTTQRSTCDEIRLHL